MDISLSDFENDSLLQIHDIDVAKVRAWREWDNNDLTPHTVTSANGGELNSGSIEADASWSHTFTQPGEFPYFCTFHPEMKGTIVVK
jgi:hypothetical protein